jgi:predicted membrane-bound spermidine synthase
MAEIHHGSTPAAWTAVVVCLVAFFVGAAGLMIGSGGVFWVGVALLVVSVVVGKVMQAMGLGAR